MKFNFKKVTICRITTDPSSLQILLKGQLKYLSKYFKMIAVSSKGSILITVGVQENVTVHGLNMTREITPFKDLISLIKLIFLFKRLKPIIVHTHTPKAGLIGMIAARICAIPIRLHTVAGLPLVEYKGFKKVLLIIAEKITYYSAHMVYPNSINLKRLIQKKIFNKVEKLKVISNGSSNGIDTNYFSRNLVSRTAVKSIKHTFEIHSKDFIFIYIGRLVSHKGLNELVIAFDLLTKKYSNVKLFLLGSYENHLDPLDKSTTQIIKNNKYIFDLGFQEDIRPYLYLSNVLVHPSYREGFPNVVLQAGSMGLPSIVTNINGNNEIIVHKVNGIIVPPKSVGSLYHAMEKFFNNPILVNRLANNTRIMIEKRYEQKKFWEAIKTEYFNKLTKEGIPLTINRCE